MTYIFGNSEIRQAFETTFIQEFPIDTASENNSYKPVAGKPYAELAMLFAAPENPTMGDGFYRQRGIFQVNLNYPSNVGSGDASDMADSVQSYFKRGLRIGQNPVKVIIDKTPAIGGGSNVGDRYLIVVRVTFYADIFESEA